MSIRLRLVLWYVIFLVITVLGFGVALHFLLVAHVMGEVDRTLRSRSDDIIRLSELGASFTGVRPREGIILMPPSNEFGEPGIYVQVLDGEGVPVITSINLQGQSLPVTEAAQRALATGQEEFETVELAGGYRIRMFSRPLLGNGRAQGVLQDAHSLQLADSTVDRFRNQLIGGSVGVVLVAALSGWYLTRKALDPVDAVRRTAEAIYRRGDLSRRIDVGRGADELTTLGRTFNRMLDRVEQGVRAQQRFIGDASHELKTPLTVIRGNSELAARDPGETHIREAIDAIQREATRMQRVVDDLLAVAELDAAPQIQFAALDARDLARRVSADLAGIAAARTIAVSGSGDATVNGDTETLEHAVRNLVDNAITATESDGRIEIDVSTIDGSVALSVRDDGPGIPEEHLSHVFERFYRVDKARSRAHGGTGLGLTIVQSVVAAHGGTVTARNQAGGGAEITITLPAVSREILDPPSDTSASENLTVS